MGSPLKLRRQMTPTLMAGTTLLAKDFSRHFLTSKPSQGLSLSRSECQKTHWICFLGAMRHCWRGHEQTQVAIRFWSNRKGLVPHERWQAPIARWSLARLVTRRPWPMNLGLCSQRATLGQNTHSGLSQSPSSSAVLHRPRFCRDTSQSSAPYFAKHQCICATTC